MAKKIKKVVTKRVVTKSKKKTVKTKKPKVKTVKFSGASDVETDIDFALGNVVDKEATSTIETVKQNTQFYNDIAESIKEEQISNASNEAKLSRTVKKIVGSGPAHNVVDHVFRLKEIAARLGIIADDTIDEVIAERTEQTENSFHPFDESKYPFLKKMELMVMPFLLDPTTDRATLHSVLMKKVRETIPNTTKMVRVNGNISTPLYADKSWREPEPESSSNNIDDLDLKEMSPKRESISIEPDALANIFELTFTMMDYVVESDNLTEEQRKSFVSEVKRTLAGQYLKQVQRS